MSKKENYIAIRTDDGTVDKLDQLCMQTYRTKSDMLRYLISQEHERVFGSTEIEKQPECLALDESAA